MLLLTTDWKGKTKLSLEYSNNWRWNQTSNDNFRKGCGIECNKKRSLSNKNWRRRRSPNLCPTSAWSFYGKLITIIFRYNFLIFLVFLSHSGKLCRQYHRKLLPGLESYVSMVPWGRVNGAAPHPPKWLLLFSNKLRKHLVRNVIGKILGTYGTTRH